MKMLSLEQVFLGPVLIWLSTKKSLRLFLGRGFRAKEAFPLAIDFSLHRVITSSNFIPQQNEEHLSLPEIISFSPSRSMPEYVDACQVWISTICQKIMRDCIRGCMPSVNFNNLSKNNERLLSVWSTPFTFYSHELLSLLINAWMCGCMATVNFNNLSKIMRHCYLIEVHLSLPKVMIFSLSRSMPEYEDEKQVSISAICQK